VIGISHSPDPQVVVIRHRADVLKLIPHARGFTFEGQNLIAIPHGIEETRMLRNLDMPVPAPIVEHYDYPGPQPPFLVQKLTTAMMTMQPRMFVLNDMGTGKTRCAIWSFDFLNRRALAKKMLVVCPISTMHFVWEREIKIIAPWLKVSVLYGNKEKRLARLAENWDIAIINHDGIATIFEHLMCADIDVVVLDEAALFRNYRAIRSKLARKLCRNKKWVWPMTGSPTPNAPTDAYGLAMLAIPHKAPSSFLRFRDMTMIQIDQFNWKPKPDAAETVARLLQPATRYSLDDVVELPEVVERQIDIAQGPQQRAAYTKLKERAAIDLREGRITAVNGGVVLMKLLQISAGYVYMDDGQTAKLDNDERLEMLEQIIENAKQKVIVFSPWIHSAQAIDQFLRQKKIEHCTVTGSTPMGQRGDFFKRFQQTSEFKVLNAHPACMSHGLTLTKADTIVWFAPITSNEIFEQANARIRRVGQSHKQQVLMLAGTTAERRAYSRLRQKQELQDSVLDLLAEITAS
jgi:SNF2 family DNA or RNA helicase